MKQEKDYGVEGGGHRIEGDNLDQEYWRKIEEEFYLNRLQGHFILVETKAVKSNA